MMSGEKGKFLEGRINKMKNRNAGFSQQRSFRVAKN